MKTYKATIEITEEEFNDCRKCRHLQSGSSNFGRTTMIKCRLTKKGDFSCEYPMDEDRAIEYMREACPFKENNKS